MNWLNVSGLTGGALVLLFAMLRAERKRLWPKVVELYGGYQDYQERTEREIPLVILEAKPFP